MKEETPEQTNARLLTVIGNSEFRVLPGVYVFEPLPEGPEGVSPEALACVRDGEQWSELVPASDDRRRTGHFTIFSFHFDQRFDATGFVGWLHSHLARTTGVGHIVICGRDQRSGPALNHVRGGIFDYWGLPSGSGRRRDRRGASPHRPRRTYAMKSIYLDYNATTPLDPAARAAMAPFLDEHFGNPSSAQSVGNISMPRHASSAIAPRVAGGPLT